MQRKGPLQEKVSPRAYTPALRFRFLTRIYDPLIERWMATSRMRAAVIEVLDLRPGMRVMELGCGPGRLAVEIKRRHPDVMLEAADVDPEMIAMARRNADQAGVEIVFHEADVTRLPPGGRYERVYSTLVFHHLKPEGKCAALRWVAKALGPGGRFVVADFGRPHGLTQWLVSHLVQLLDGIANTAPHRDGRFERMLGETFGTAEHVTAWKTFAGTLQVWICRPRA